MSYELLSPIPGKVLKIFFAEGDDIQEDEEVMKIESMKMENPIYSPVSGKIAKIAVKVNDEVEIDDLLVVIE
ncbi:MAG: acetyl-CoA carboxylase biotin carboxyl carrier protein subunit [Syntrophales bacterium]|nr:acetyl-CoA carboxylase biotin carboxyl carrier protein subunit [Syntrophales bacterium]